MTALDVVIILAAALAIGYFAGLLLGGLVYLCQEWRRPRDRGL